MSEAFLIRMSTNGISRRKDFDFKNTSGLTNDRTRVKVIRTTPLNTPLFTAILSIFISCNIMLF
jgi:hypothetical protein